MTTLEFLKQLTKEGNVTWEEKPVSVARWDIGEFREDNFVFNYLGSGTRNVFFQIAHNIKRMPGSFLIQYAVVLRVNNKPLYETHIAFDGMPTNVPVYFDESRALLAEIDAQLRRTKGKIERPTELIIPPSGLLNPVRP